MIVDSYVGLFPEGSQGFEAACEAGTANIQDVFDNAIASHPEVAFAVIQPKYDLVQRVYLAAIAASHLSSDLYQSPTIFCDNVNAMLQRWGGHHNFVNCYVDGGFHTFLWFGAYYSATVTSATGLLGKGGMPSMSEWVNALIEHEPVQSACNGALERPGGDNFGVSTTA